jgi:hypothetical protein
MTPIHALRMIAGSASDSSGDAVNGEGCYDVTRFTPLA